MHANVTEPGGTVVPTLRYRDVAAAIDWLCNTFGFEKHLVVSGGNGAVRYAELTFGSGMIMLGPVEDSGLDKFMTQPADTGGAETQICYLFVADAAAHCAKAKAAGAEIVLDIEDADSNGRGYSCRDLEGHIWNLGTYDPWRRQPALAVESSRSSTRQRGGLQRLGVLAGLPVVIAVSALMVGWALGMIDVDDLGLKTIASASVSEAAASTEHDQLTQERAAREAAERAVKAAKEQLARERGERESLERLARSVREQLGQERTARETAERATKEIQAQLARENVERAVKQAGDPPAKTDTDRALDDARRITQEARERLSLAERASEAVQEQLDAERSAREAAELAARQVREQLAKERGAKETAERMAKEAREEEAKDRTARRPSPPPRARLVQQPPSKPFITWDR
jgi:uncharacterized glyoxalase superfamily protein PhnB